jgi:hypothetical protein
MNDVAGAYTTALVLNYLAGRRQQIELGIGPLVEIASDSTRLYYTPGGSLNKSALKGVAVVAHRFQPVDGGFQFRFAFTSMFDTDGIFPFIGISFGSIF